MRQIKKGKVIIAGDIHANLAWINTVLEKEKPFDYFVNLSDHFDTFHRVDNNIIFSTEQICEWINSKLDDERIIWLISNHDLAYLASYSTSNYPPKGSFYSCSGWTRNKAKTFNREINPEWFKKIELCCQVGDFVVSHAGFHYDKFLPYMSEMDNIQRLYNEWEKDKLIFHHKPWHWIGEVGSCRGGMDNVGSPVWLDFFNEFIPLDETKQIIGHSSSWENPTIKKNSIGFENYCIDKNQTCYMVWENGKIELKYITSRDYKQFLNP